MYYAVALDVDGDGDDPFVKFAAAASGDADGDAAAAAAASDGDEAKGKDPVVRMRLEITKEGKRLFDERVLQEVKMMMDQAGKDELGISAIVGCLLLTMLPLAPISCMLLDCCHW